jgi:hypothetical protein
VTEFMCILLSALFIQHVVVCANKNVKCTRKLVKSCTFVSALYVSGLSLKLSMGVLEN